LRDSLHVNGLALLLLALPLLSATSLGTSGTRAQGVENEYVYYGFVPANISGRLNRHIYTEAATYNTTKAFLAVVGNLDGTRVRVYKLPDEALVQEFTVDKLQNVTLTLSNNTFFKVVASKPVSAVLMGGVSLEMIEAMISTFFTSVEGGYIGREFVFMAVQAKIGLFQSGTWAIPPGLPFNAYALEDSQVSIYDADGNKVAGFELKANKRRALEFTPYRVYRLVSTGNVMLQTFTTDSPCFYPAVPGGFLGTLFYGSSTEAENWGASWARGNLTFVASSREDATLSVADLDYRKKIGEEKVAAGQDSQFPIKVVQISVKSDKPILLMFKSDDRDGGIAVAGLKAGQEAYVYVPPGKAYVFAYKETVVTVDDVRLQLKPDEALPITEGVHKLSATENIVLEAVNHAAGQGIANFGQCLPAVQSLDVTSEQLKLTPVVSEELPWAYIAGAVAVVAVVLLVVWSKRRKPQA